MLVIAGTVVAGKGEARKLGYPTANIAYESAVAPEPGVWIAEVTLGDEKRFGLAVVGMWELPNGLPSVEVHILDHAADLYGQRIGCTLKSKIRQLLPFVSNEALIAQIQEDIAIARAA